MLEIAYKAKGECCPALRIEGAEDVIINQGVGINLYDGVTAYDADGNEIEFDVDPTEIDKCDVGEHLVRYSAIGKDNDILPTLLCGSNAITIPSACDSVDTVTVERTVTITQADPPTFEGLDMTDLTVGEVFDPTEGVTATDDNGNVVDFTYYGKMDDSAEGGIASFETDLTDPLVSLKVSLDPIQDGTPWIGTETDTTPYLYRAMPSQSNDYNRESGVIVGGTVAWNQLCKDGDFTGNRDALGGGWSVGGRYGTMSYANNVGTYTVAIVGSASYNNAINNHYNNHYPIQLNHIYFCTADIYPAHNKQYFTFWLNRSTASDGANERSAYVSLEAGKWQTATGIIKSKASTGYFQVAFDCTADEGYSVGDSDMIRNTMCIDLTAMFGSTIADYIYSLEQATAGAGVAWFRKYFPEDYYPYSANTLQSVQATAHKTYDGDGNVIGNYALDSSLTLRGIPKLDASNNLYYDGDTYESDGTVTRKYGIVDLGTLTWTKWADTQKGFYASISPQAKGSLGTERANAICEKLVPDFYSSVVNGSADKSFAIASSTHLIYAYDSALQSGDATAFKTAMSGVYLVYELATPTTETADAYTNPQTVDPDGTEEYVTTGIVPVGHDSTYSLVCPISGYDEASANVVGKNWFDLSSLRQGDFNSSLSTQNVTTDEMIPIKGGQTYMWSQNASVNGRYLRFYDADGNHLSDSNVSQYDAINATFIAPDNATFMRAMWYISSGTLTPNDVVALEPQIELGSTATAYEPYNGQSYTTQLGQTVYGGKVDLVSGVLVVDRAMVTLGDVGNISTSATGTGKYVSWNAGMTLKANGEITCDRMKGTTFAHRGNAYECYQGNADSVYIQTFVPSDATVQSVNEALSGATAIVTLATPQTYQLTPQQIQTLVGQNNVWSEQGEVWVRFTKSIPQGEFSYPLEGEYSIEYTAEDECGNSITDARIINVEEVTP